MAQGETPEKTVPRSSYYALIWSLCGVALLFFTARIAIRLKVYKRLMVDDGLMILAVVCLLAQIITTTVGAPTMFIIQDVRIQHRRPPRNYDHLTESYARSQWATAYCFFTGIWAVKGSFLAFYDGLTKRLRNYRRAWWAVIAFTVATYVGSLFAYAFLDGMHFRHSSQNEAVKYQFSADLTTDILITAIPLTLLRKSQIDTRQKWVLAGMFSLTLVITIFSIIRFVLVSPHGSSAAPSWIQSWSTIEQAISIVIASCASFRVMVVNNARSRRGPSSPHHHNFMNSFSARNRQKKAVFDLSGFSQLQSSEERLRSNEASTNIELPERAHESNAG